MHAPSENTAPPPAVKDARFAAAQAWLAHVLAGIPFTLTIASADASFRRYLRVTLTDGNTRILMDAPPPAEDVRPWLHAQRIFAAAGVHVPHVLAADVAQGFLLLEDMGNTTYLAAMSAQPEAADALYRHALTALVRLQGASQPGIFAAYDQAALERELRLFPDWYVARHLGLHLSGDEEAALTAAFATIMHVNLAEPCVFVHRDYHARNLMVCPVSPGVIDFQDALFGPITYDLVSLFRDAYIVWPEAQVLDWLARYWEMAKKAGLPVHRDFGMFYRDFEWMGIQRHLKVLGIFARLYHRDGKTAYLADMPRVAAYLRAALSRYTPLTPLLRILDRLEGKAAAASAYTF